MSVKGGPKIITDGLLLYLDAANEKSYPGSGTIWNDLSGNGNNGDLINNVVYDTENNGILLFDGTNEYCQLDDSLENQLNGIEEATLAS